MDSEYPPAAWERLGRELAKRRENLGYGFRKRKKFLEENGKPTSVRMLERIEHGQRPGYPPETIEMLERLYRCEPGSFEAILQGRRLTLEVAEAPPAQVPSDATAPLSLPGADPADLAAAARVFPGDKAAQALLLGGDVQGLAEWLDYRRERAARGYPEDNPGGREGAAGLIAAPITGQLRATPRNYRICG